MRLHTNTLNPRDFHAVASDLDGVYVTAVKHGSRTHEWAFEVSLEGNGYAKNTGQYGASDENSATWDEWGIVIARLYEIDPSAVWGSVKAPIYSGEAEFHWVTGDRFRTLEHDRTTEHRRHRFAPTGMSLTGSYYVGQCKCGAVRRHMARGRDFAELAG